MTNFDKNFIELINNPLILKTFNKQQIFELMAKVQGSNLFFGAGIMTQNKLSAATPFDILGFFFTAEQLRRSLNGEKVVVFIAEQHAFSNELFPEQKIRQQTDLMIDTVNRIISNFNLVNFQIIRTSQLQQEESIKKIFRQELPKMSNQYLQHEVADVIWLNRFHDVKLKLGWAMSSEIIVTGHDERFFDQEIKKFCDQVEFIYLKPGRTFDLTRSRVSPYISVDKETRLLLKKGQNIQQLLESIKETESNDVAKATFRHLCNIVRLHDQIFQPLKFMTMTEKIQWILNKSIN
jgi:hypothetical protein